MGCGKSKQSVATNDGMFRKSRSTNAGPKNRGEIRFEPFPSEKENPAEIVEAKARDEADDFEKLEPEMGGERDNVDAEPLPRPGDVTESRELPQPLMALLAKEEGTEDGAGGQKEEERGEEKKDATMEEVDEEEEKKDVTLEEEEEKGAAAAALEEGSEGRLISRDSPDHYFSSRKEDEALEGILSEYNSPLHVDAKKTTQEVPAGGDLKAKEEAAAAVATELMIGAEEPKALLAADAGQMNPAPST